MGFHSGLPGGGSLLEISGMCFNSLNVKKSLLHFHVRCGCMDSGVGAGVHGLSFLCFVCSEFGVYCSELRIEGAVAWDMQRRSCETALTRSPVGGNRKGSCVVSEEDACGVVVEAG